MKKKQEKFINCSKCGRKLTLVFDNHGSLDFLLKANTSQGWTNIDNYDALCPKCSAATSVQPIPHGSGTPIVDLVRADLEARAVEGEKKYGERLKANNGRDALVDAYQEALDLCMYLRQAIEERGAGEKVNGAVTE
jgi:hypothetical protein